MIIKTPMKFHAFKTTEVSLDEIAYEDETYKMRQDIDEGFVRRLAGSIRNYGLLHPPVLNKNENMDKYRIVSGYCRLAALNMLSDSQPKYGKVNVLIINDNDFSHLEMLKLAHEENHKRNFITYLEKALKASELRNEHALSNKEIAGVMDISKKGVERLLNLVNKTHKDVKRALHEGKIGFKHTQILISLEKTDQKKMLKRVIEEKLSADKLNELLKERKEDANKKEFQDFLENPPEGIDIKKVGRGEYEVISNIKGIDNMRALFKAWKEME
ncbi:MAG: ParB/RepB/Spo0J family partition protein [Flavobacteriales bacterium]